MMVHDATVKISRLCCGFGASACLMTKYSHFKHGLYDVLIMMMAIDLIGSCEFIHIFFCFRILSKSNEAYSMRNY